jgi:hypothetical protein
MIPSRRADLRALAPPLPAIAAAGLLTRIIGGSGAGSGSAGMAGGTGIAGIVGGKTVTLGLVAKAVTTVVIVSGATVGITNAVEHSAAVRHHTVPAVRANPSHASASPATAHRPGHAKTGSVTLTTPAAVRATGRSTHAAAFHTRGKSASAPSAALARGVVKPPGRSISSAVVHAHGSGSGLGVPGSSTKSPRGQALGSQQGSRSISTTAHPLNAHAVGPSKAAGLQLHLAHLLG